MTVKFKIKFKDVEKTLRKKLIPGVRKEYAKTARRPLVSAIRKDILRGVSPVRGERFPKYSKSYKEQIRGKAYYFTNKNGKVVRVVNPKLTALEVALKGISPVNLKVTGQMLKSLTSKLRGSFFGLVGPKLIIMFKDEVAQYHNELGAGPPKVLRRLLPTDEGEKFNLRITRLNNRLLDTAVRRVVAKINK